MESQGRKTKLKASDSDPKDHTPDATDKATVCECSCKSQIKTQEGAERTDPSTGRRDFICSVIALSWAWGGGDACKDAVYIQ